MLLIKNTFLKKKILVIFRLFMPLLDKYKNKKGWFCAEIDNEPDEQMQKDSMTTKMLLVNCHLPQIQWEEVTNYLFGIFNFQ